MTTPRADVANALSITVNRGLGSISSKPSPGSIGQNLKLASLSGHRSEVSRDATTQGPYKAAIVNQGRTAVRNPLFLGALFEALGSGQKHVHEVFEAFGLLNSFVPHSTHQSAASSFSCPQYAHFFISPHPRSPKAWRDRYFQKVGIN
jgi:hypothetical protein